MRRRSTRQTSRGRAPRRRSRAPVWITILVTAGIVTSAGAQGMDPLRAGDEREYRLEGGTRVTHPLELAAKDFVRLIVVQDGIDVVARLHAPDGATLVEMDSPNGVSGPEPIAAVTTVAGTYQLEVASLDPSADAGQVRVRLEAIRPAGPRERAWAAAEVAMARAAALAWSGRRDALEEAAARYQAAIEHWREAERPADEAATHLTRGHVLRRLARHDEAKRDFGVALAQLTHLEDAHGEARARNALCLVHQELGDLDDALAQCEAAFEGFLQLADNAQAGRTLNNLGLIHQRAGDLDDALDAYDRALETLRAAGDTHTYAIALGNSAAVLDTRGDYALARARFEEALPMLAARQDHRRVAETYNNLAVTLRHQGALQDALDRLDQASRAFDELGDASRAAAIRLNSAALDAWLGRPERCVRQLEPLLPGFEARGEPKPHAAALHTLGLCRGKSGDHEQALKELRAALDVYRAAGDRSGEASVFRSLGQQLMALGRAVHAGPAFEDAREIARTIGRRPLERAATQDLAAALLEAGDLEGARARADQALAIATALDDPRARFEAHRGSALVARARGDHATTIHHVEAGLVQAEQLRAELISPNRRTTFFATVRDLYELAVDTHLARHRQSPDEGHAEAAFAWAERARARTLLELVDQPLPPGAGSPAQITERDRLRQQIEALAHEASLAEFDTRAAADPDRTELRRLLDALDELETHIRRADPAFAKVAAPAPLTLTDVQSRLLGANDLLLSYLLGEPRSHAFAVTRDRVQTWVLPGRATIETQARRVAHQWTSLDLTARDAHARAAKDLANLILAPVQPALANRRLLIVPDGALSAVPFGALPVSSTDDRPLLADHALAYLSSASVLDALRARVASRAIHPVATHDGAATLVIADPVFDARDPRLSGRATPSATTRQAEHGHYPRLPASRREGTLVAEVTRRHGPTRLAFDFEADRALLLDPETRHYQLVHLATHAVVNDAQPSLSGIVLSRVTADGAPRDGFLRLHEIYRLPLAADLVVLSACGTAAGRTVRGEGLLGLTHGFFAAGASTVVATLWPIDDRAGAAFMAHFYSALLEARKSPAEALRAAQQALHASGRWRHPYYWAGYVVQGDALRPLDVPAAR